jgi:hypothetical protein
MAVIKNMIGFALLCLVMPVTAVELIVMDFSKDAITTFKQQSFVGKTSYQVVELNGEQVLKAATRKTASALYREIEVDLTSTPYLNWRWRVENNYKIDDQESKAGDDYPARVYVVVKTGIFPWQTRALNYVWSNTVIEKPFWPNPFTGKAMMLPLRSTADEFGRWYPQRVNVAEDYYRVFGERIQSIQGIAIMSDSDNSGGSAIAYYGNINFSK